MTVTTVCLNMIVRNEAHVIERCLRSVLPFIDRWVVVDTGSEDGTQDLVRTALASIPGTLHERIWKNFAHNRNEALTLASSVADYVFFIDADETLALPPGYQRPALGADAYNLWCEYAGSNYTRCALIRSQLPWRWQGVVHEFVECGQPVNYAALEGPHFVIAHDGARSRDPQTYVKDAALLEEALRTEPGNTRNVFYLAQSYRDAGNLARSREVYERRAQMGGWDEEVWYSLYQVAVLSEKVGDEAAQVSSRYLRAFEARPTRAEPLVELARYHRQRSEYAVAFLYAQHAASIVQLKDLLFVEQAAYRWRALDELAISAYYCDQREAGRAAVQRLLQDQVFPESERPRILKNAEFYGIAAGVTRTAPHSM